MLFTYPKNERLCSHNLLERLFSEGKIIHEYPLKIVWLREDLPENIPVQTAISVSKKRFKRAVKRNILKRRMREAFRLNKHLLYDAVQSRNIQIAAIILYNSNEISEFKEIETSLKSLLAKLIKKINSLSPNSPLPMPE